MKLLDTAALKLTAVYTGVLMLVSLCFSVAVGVTAMREVSQSFSQSPLVIFRYDEDRQTVERIFSDRHAQANGRILATLVLANLGVLVLGATGSYFLARWTLRPINDAMNAQSRFVSDASHELRTPLAAMQMENEVLLRDKSPSKDSLTKQIASNLEEVGKLQELTDRLLRLGRDEELKTSEIEVKTVVKNAINRASATAKPKKITIENRVAAQKITANVGALTDVVAILLDNAIKYSPAKSVVKVDADERGISVCDEGPGVATDDLPRIFDRFYRAEKSRTTGGYGLGLSLAQDLAEKMNLKITVENNKTHGATFWICS